MLAFVIANALIIAGFVFLAPLTYGTPGLSAEEVHNRRLLSTWTLVSPSVSRPVTRHGQEVTDFGTNPQHFDK